MKVVALQQIKKKRLEEDITSMVEGFDRALGTLRAEKFSLEADMKAGEVRYLVMWKEFLLLNDFGKKDAVLAVKLDERHADRKVRRSL